MADWHKDKKGYPRFNDSNKLVHRWKVEKRDGRNLGNGEVVHHRNENKGDYSNRNLQRTSRSSHSRHHAKKRGWW